MTELYQLPSCELGEPLPANGMSRAISREELPADVGKILVESAQDAGVDLRAAAEIANLSEITHTNGDKTYYGTFSNVPDGFIDQDSTVLVDTNWGGVVSGVGRIDYFRDFRGMPGLVGSPFVGFTKTAPEFRRQRLAERRLFTMNAISEPLYGEPLHSGTHQAQGIEPMWDKLVHSGVAEMLPPDSEFKYSFLRSGPTK